MKLIVDLENPYEVEIGSNIIEKLNSYLKENYKNSKILIISDDLVYKIHGKKIEKELEGFSYKKFILENCPIHEVEEKIEKETGFIIKGHSFEFTGICPDCQKKHKI